MRARRAVLFCLVVLPGLMAIIVCGYYLFSDWSALITAFARFEKATASGDARSLAVAQYLDSVYRINAFADGVGVMLGALLFGIGLHGLCLLPSPQAVDPRVMKRTAAQDAVGAMLVIVMALGGAFGLIERVGSTNALRRAIVRGDRRQAEQLIGQGADPHDRFWWGISAAEAGGPGPLGIKERRPTAPANPHPMPTDPESRTGSHRRRR